MQNPRAFGRTVFITTVAQLINLSLPLLTFSMLLKTFDLATYGIWIEAGTIASLLTTFTGYGLYNAVGAIVVQKEHEPGSVYFNALYVFLVVGGGSALLMAAAAPLINSFTIRDPVGPLILRILSLTVLTGSLSLFGSQICRLRQQPLRGSTFDVLLGLGRLAAVIFAFVSRDLMKFAIVFALIQVAIVSVQIGVAFWKMPFSPPAPVILRKLVHHGVNLAVVNQADWVIQYGDRLMLSILSTSSAVAIYSASYQLTFILTAIAGPYLYAILPLLGEAWKSEDLKPLQALIRQSTRPMTLFLIPAVIGLGVVGNSLLALLGTPEFAQGGFLIGMLSIGMGLSTLGVNLQYIFQVQGKTKLLRNIFVLIALFNFLVNLAAIPLLGYYGAGLTTLITFGCTFYLLWRNTGIRFRDLFDVNALWRCVVAGAVMGIPISFIVAPDVLSITLAIVAGAIVYGLGIVLFGAFKISELKRYTSMLLRRQDS